MAEPTILLTRDQINAQIDIVAAIPAIEEAMATFEKGQDYLPPKAVMQIPVEAEGEFAACITGYTRVSNLLSMKVGQERSDNPALGLPTTNSWIMAFNPDTGELMMICDGTLPTMYRTAAAAAVSTKHLSRTNATSLGVVGCGQLGRQCIRAISSVRPFRSILVFDMVDAGASRLVADLEGTVDAPIRAVDAETLCRESDVVVTATNSRTPIVQNDWIRPGTHLCCMGADLDEKIECEMALLTRCSLYADFIEHASQRGEASQAIAKGLLKSNCYRGSLGAVINGDTPGRTDEGQITMYDGVGIGIQDTTIARSIYDQAMAKGLGTKMCFS